MKKTLFTLLLLLFSGLVNAQIIKVKKKQNQEVEEVIYNEMIEVEAPEISSSRKLDRGVYEENGKFGLKFNENIITEAIYDRIYLVDKYDSRYFVTKDGKQGVIDKTGKQLLSCSYGYIRKINSNSTHYEVTTDRKTGIFDSKENEVLPMIYDNISENDLGYTISINNKKGLADKKGKVIFPTEYDQVFEYGEGSDFVILKRNERYSIANKEGIFLRKDDIKQIYRINDTKGINAIRYKKKGRNLNEKRNYILSFIDSNDLAGAIDFKKGKIIIPPIYTFIFQYYQGNMIVKKGDKFGLINPENKLVINFDYDSLLIQNPDNRQDVNSIIAFDKGKCGLIDLKGKVITPFKYSSIQSIYKGKYKAKTGDQEYYILNQDGTLFQEKSFLQVGIFDLGKAAIFNENGLYYIDTNGISTSNISYHEGYSSLQEIEKKFILALKDKDYLLLQKFVDKISISKYTLEYMERIKIEYRGFPSKINYSNSYSVNELNKLYYNNLRDFKQFHIPNLSVDIKSEIRISDVKTLRDKERKHREYYIVDIHFYIKEIDASIVLDNLIFLDGSWVSFSSSIKKKRRKR